MWSFSAPDGSGGEGQRTLSPSLLLSGDPELMAEVPLEKEPTPAVGGGSGVVVSGVLLALRLPRA